jgi:DNA-binding MarR family transcriptional regulator
MVANESTHPAYGSPGFWAKKQFLASRALMEAVLRSYDLGNTQWYVLHRLVNQGSVSQRDLGRELDVERATLSGVISVLVRKGLVEQRPDPEDQRQKVLTITPDGRELWKALPDPIALITSVAFDGVNEADLATTKRVLSAATERLINYKKELRKS